MNSAVPFVLAAVPEGRNNVVVAEGDTSLEGLQEKMSYIVDTISGRLRTMGVDWRDATAVQLYTVHDVHSLLSSVLFDKLGAAIRHGVHWHHAQPPVEGVAVELDLRSVRTELMVPL